MSIGSYSPSAFPYIPQSTVNPWDNNLQHLPMHNYLNPFPVVNTFVSDTDNFLTSFFNSPMLSPGFNPYNGYAQQMGMNNPYAQAAQTPYSPQIGYNPYGQPQQMPYNPYGQQPQQAQQMQPNQNILGSILQMLTTMISLIQNMMGMNTQQAPAQQYAPAPVQAAPAPVQQHAPAPVQA
ncbi:MAG TPA: hypothetical protein DDX14_09940, partial [Cyanobacteria bacterium UBA9579]|nr:hypothetical protein [Cyanobacteria bacterium UBA9579]